MPAAEPGSPHAGVKMTPGHAAALLGDRKRKRGTHGAARGSMGGEESRRAKRRASKLDRRRSKMEKNVAAARPGSLTSRQVMASGEDGDRMARDGPWRKSKVRPRSIMGR